MPNLLDKLSAYIVKAISLNAEKKDRVVKRIKLYAKVGGLVKKRGFETLKINANGVPVELTKPLGTTPKKLLFVIHGGAFIMPLTNIYRNFAFTYSNSLDGAAVLNIDYRVAPEHCYPAAHDDILTAWDFVVEQLGYKPKDIALCGDSAGGNLALSLILKLRDAKRPLPAAAALMSPWADLNASGNSYKEKYSCDVLFGRKRSKMHEDDVREHLLNCGVFSYSKDADRSDPYLSPALADYHDFVPTIITVGTNEMLLDDSLTLYKKITEANGTVETIIGEGMYHCYPLYKLFSTTAKADFNRLMTFVNKYLNNG